MLQDAFHAGYRLSVLDVIVIMIALGLAWFLHDIQSHMSYSVLFVVGHFFYFCNLTRMSRVPEIIWAISFVSLFLLDHYHILSSYMVYSISLCVTFIITLKELKKPSYHGIFWQKINPNLPIWFEENKKEFLISSSARRLRQCK